MYGCGPGAGDDRKRTKYLGWSQISKKGLKIDSAAISFSIFVFVFTFVCAQCSSLPSSDYFAVLNDMN